MKNEDISLDDAIREYIEQGEADPLTIFQKLSRRYGKAWIEDRLLADMPEYVTSRVRLMITNTRTGIFQAAERGGTYHGREPEAAILNVGRWVPDVGYKRIGDLTAADCHSIADHYGRLARTYTARAMLFENFAKLIEDAGVERLGEIEVALPDLKELTA